MIIKPVRIKTSSIVTTWQCPVCMNMTSRNFDHLLEVGKVICFEYKAEMEYLVEAEAICIDYYAVQKA